MWIVRIDRGQIDGEVQYFFESEELARACAKKFDGLSYEIRPLDHVPKTVWGY